MYKNRKQTSSRLASEASKVLRNPKSTAKQKSLAGSVLSQSNTSKQTGKRMETVASKTVFGKGTDPVSRRLAGSAMSQSNKKR
jgi:hypothetical protein